MKTEQAYTKQEVDEIVRKAIRQERELWVPMFRGLPDMDAETRQDWIGNPDLVQEQLAGFAVSPLVAKVDRLVKPVYPDWVEKVIHPELQIVGPAEFNLKTDVTLWLHDGQKDGGVIIGNPIYEHLRDKNMFKTCLNLQDGLAIQKKGVAVFRKLFEGKAIFLWKSVVRDRSGYLNVPYLCDGDFRVVVRWNGLGNDFDDNNPAARFGK